MFLSWTALSSTRLYFRFRRARGHTYKCPARSNGALLSLPHGGRREDVIHRKPFKKYFQDNVVSWFKWARNNNNLDVERIEDLILVTGCTLVTSWAAAALDDRTTPVDGATISLDSQTFHSGGAQFFWRTICGNVEYHNSFFDSVRFHFVFATYADFLFIVLE